jgi:site-specific recombinase XerD
MLMADFKKAGVVFPQDGKARDFHSLRHSAISAWVIAGDLRTAQELAGHSTPVLTARYSHPQQSQLRTVINAANAIAPPATP